jgi:hypothetical protein
MREIIPVLSLRLQLGAQRSLYEIALQHGLPMLRCRAEARTVPLSGRGLAILHAQDRDRIDRVLGPQRLDGRQAHGVELAHGHLWHQRSATQV